MEIINLREVEGSTNKRGVTSKQLINHENTTVMNLQLSPGDVVPEHSVPVDVFFYVVEGRGTLTIGGESAVVEEKQIIVCPPNTTMSLEADQGQSFNVLNVKTPSLGKK